MTIDLPKAAPDNADSVVVIEVGGEIAADSGRLLQPSFATDTLRVFDAQLHGRNLHFGPGKVRDALVTGWTNADNSITWSARLNEPANYEVEIVYDADPEAAEASFMVSFGSDVLRGKVKPGIIQTTPLGRVALQAGNVEIKLSSSENRKDELMRPRSLALKRVEK